MQITIDLGSDTIDAELPEVPITFPVAPGGTLYGFLQNFYPENLLKKGHLYDAQECREIRAKNTRKTGRSGASAITAGISSAGKSTTCRSPKPWNWPGCFCLAISPPRWPWAACLAAAAGPLLRKTLGSRPSFLS
jgi:hypothetical protein